MSTHACCMTIYTLRNETPRPAITRYIFNRYNNNVYNSTNEMENSEQMSLTNVVSLRKQIKIQGHNSFI